VCSGIPPNVIRMERQLKRRSSSTSSRRSAFSRPEGPGLDLPFWVMEWGLALALAVAGLVLDIDWLLLLALIVWVVSTQLLMHERVTGQGLVELNERLNNVERLAGGAERGRCEDNQDEDYADGEG
jgi:hypothetical protein